MNNKSYIFCKHQSDNKKMFGSPRELIRFVYNKLEEFFSRGGVFQKVVPVLNPALELYAWRPQTFF